MSLKEIHETIWAWLSEGDNGILKLFTIQGEQDDDGEVTDDSAMKFTPGAIGKAEITKKYIDGSCEMRYPFALDQVITLSSAFNEDVNVVAMDFFESVAAWIYEQNQSAEYPDFGKDITVISIEAEPGAIVGITEENAKLQIQIIFDYLERG